MLRPDSSLRRDLQKPIIWRWHFWFPGDRHKREIFHCSATSSFQEPSSPASSAKLAQYHTASADQAIPQALIHPRFHAADCPDRHRQHSRISREQNPLSDGNPAVCMERCWTIQVGLNQQNNRSDKAQTAIHRPALDCPQLLKNPSTEFALQQTILHPGPSSDSRSLDGSLLIPSRTLDPFASD